MLLEKNLPFRERSFRFRFQATLFFAVAGQVFDVSLSIPAHTLDVAVAGDFRCFCPHLAARACWHLWVSALVPFILLVALGKKNTFDGRVVKNGREAVGSPQQ